MKLRNQSVKVGLLLVCIGFLAFSKAGISAISPATVSAKLADSTCLQSTYSGAQLDAYVYYKGYLFCEESDQFSNGEQLYQSNGSGGFTFIRGGGGAYRAEDLASLASVPQAVATYLVNSMDTKLQAIQDGTQQPLITPAPTNRP